MEKPNTGPPPRSGQGMPPDRRKEEESGKKSQHSGAQDWRREEDGSKTSGSERLH